MNSPSGFATALHANGPAPDRADKLDLYGRFIGDWDAEVITHSADGVAHHGRGEIHFGWVLEGRAIQDVWMIPRREDRRPDAPAMPVSGNWYGTTLRIYDPALDAWRIYWIDPATNSFRYQVGRRQGDDIVQEGSTESGARSRWSFTDITTDSFRWLGESSADGKTWRLVVEARARRRIS
ncbi:MAG: hypothetical protein ACREND_00770 [Gemmatimonadaceae bacterium]